MWIVFVSAIEVASNSCQQKGISRKINLMQKTTFSNYINSQHVLQKKIIKQTCFMRLLLFVIIIIRLLHALFQRPAKYYTALQTVRHRFNINASSCVALAL